MFDNIESMEAFKQKTDFCGGNMCKIIRWGSDIDFTVKLANGKVAAIEEKKDTPEHCVENIINSWQWKHIRDVCKNEHYLIYVTHDREINENEDIPIEALTVRYAEVNKQPIELPENLKLETFVNYLGSLNTYYVKVKYKTGEVEYAVKKVINHDWSMIDYFAASICFMTEESARNYIQNRYKKDFNREYVYEIWHIDENGKHDKIDEIKYEQPLTY